MTSYSSKQAQEHKLKVEIATKNKGEPCCSEVEQQKTKQTSNHVNLQLIRLVESLKATEPVLLSNLKVVSLKKNETITTLAIEILEDYGKTKEWLSEAVIGINGYQLTSFTWKANGQNQVATEKTLLTLALTLNEK